MDNQNPLPTLPFHLALSLSAWIGSTTASACLKPALTNMGGAHAKLAETLPKAVSELGRSQCISLLEGISRYQNTVYERSLPEPPVIWRSGSARLLDYGAETSDPRKPVLVIPSLINRYYILDLAPRRSLMRYLAEEGFYPLLLDWGAPGKAEGEFGFAEYVRGPLLGAFDFIHDTMRRDITLAGYCMGGVMALALAKLRQEKVRKLALLATPWDFSAQPKLAPPMVKQFEKWVLEQENVQPEFIQTLFYLNDPWTFQHKFEKLGEMAADSIAYKEFIALEHWVNDGVAMAPKVARDCLVGWGQRNELAKGLIDVKALEMPVFIAVPHHDTVVPPPCALPLAGLLPRAELLRPDTGHVGMIVGSRAKKELWQPLREWL